IAGKDGGFLGEKAQAFIRVPNPQGELVTPITEGFQGVLWHLLVSHPRLQMNQAKWESISAK
ncbi:MAG: sugar isomerase, partial [Cyanobacteria bacterium PR.023]|nr:sugar isomerase [Cyanobacteria bacterium PR.023]